MTGPLEELNRDLWHPFVRSYAERDTDTFIGLYDPALIRASGAAGQIHGYTEYAEQMRAFFARVAERGDTLAIDFRFDERLASGEVASERGVFRLTVTPSSGPVRTMYGRFHTYARRVDGRWRFVADYDTPVGADEATYQAGAGIDDVTRS
jgi:ketosteroid isomerase-like protein